MRSIRGGRSIVITVRPSHTMLSVGPPGDPSGSTYHSRLRRLPLGPLTDIPAHRRRRARQLDKRPHAPRPRTPDPGGRGETSHGSAPHSIDLTRSPGRSVRLLIALSPSLKLDSLKIGRLRAHECQTPAAADVQNACWSVDFVSEALWDARRFRTFNPVDDFKCRPLHHPETTSYAWT
jgi:hypothetical protein